MRLEGERKRTQPSSGRKPKGSSCSETREGQLSFYRQSRQDRREAAAEARAVDWRMELETHSVRQRDRMQVAAGRTYALNQSQERVPRLAGVAASSRADAEAAFRPPSQPGEPGPQHPAHARLQLRAGRGTL